MNILTKAEIIAIAKNTRTGEPGTDGYILPVSFAAEIEKAVLAKLAAWNQLEVKLKPKPMGWLVEVTFDDGSLSHRLYDDEKQCVLDAMSAGGVCKPLFTRLEQQGI